jgi:antitoxin VapB
MATAKLVRNGRGQAVHLPREFALPGHEVFIRRVGKNVLLVPKDDPWGAVESALDLFTPDFLAERMRPDPDAREPF